MQLILEIKDDSVADKIIWFLKSLQGKGVEILNYDTKEDRLMDNESDAEWAKKDWREIVMNTHSADLDDDEYLYEAAWEFYNEKHCD
jgi:hypothetical protein